jgi:hypothetical protein
LPFDRTTFPEWSPGPNVDLATYERKCPKGVRAKNEEKPKLQIAIAVYL